MAQKDADFNKFCKECKSNVAIIIDGYIRKIEKQFFGKNKDKFIPSVINQLCTEYYFLPKDRFDPVLHGHKMQIEDDVMTVTARGQFANTAFLSLILYPFVSKNNPKYN